MFTKSLFLDLAAKEQAGFLKVPSKGRQRETSKINRFPKYLQKVCIFDPTGCRRKCLLFWKISKTGRQNCNSYNCLPFDPNVVFVCLLRSFTTASPRSRRRKLCLHRFRVSTKAHPARCSSSPRKIFDFAGSPSNAQSYPVRTAVQLSRSAWGCTLALFLPAELLQSGIILA